MYLKISQTCRLHANEQVANAALPGHKVISWVSCLCVKRLVREKRAFEFCNQDTITNRTSFSATEKSEIGPFTRRPTAYIITSSCLFLSYWCCSLYFRPKACFHLMELAFQLSWDYLQDYNLQHYVLGHFFTTSSQNCNVTIVLQDITHVTLLSTICKLQLTDRYWYGAFFLWYYSRYYIFTANPFVHPPLADSKT
jgi:hypothetical protein